MTPRTALQNDASMTRHFDMTSCGKLVIIEIRIAYNNISSYIADKRPSGLRIGDVILFCGI